MIKWWLLGYMVTWLEEEKDIRELHREPRKSLGKPRQLFQEQWWEGGREISMSNAAYRYLEMRVGKYAQTGDFFKNSGMIEAC